ncbi:DUF3540 domain-containing protein [Dyella monticola]|uniref:DUF3540 domain-containing protein n=1 Tax=Dyella monticola TaxID=1927958 RepID=A0A370WV61_9GAMM|nr:DUF3540 domain-containing protein [Dyella monticola]RDS79926.1 DUF3540 domain-containing protein [Dyella monticola]
MMFATSRRSFTRNTPQLSEAVIHEALDGHVWRLEDGRAARQATSCVVMPEPGDRVLLVSMADDSRYVLHILSRQDRRGATLNVPGAERLSIRQENIDVASQTIALRAVDSVELTAVQGPLSLNARNIFASATESLVHTACTYVGQVEQFLLHARQLLRLHGEQTLVTARQDAKIDAERISLG